jgi:hypothetical protein
MTWLAAISQPEARPRVGGMRVGNLGFSSPTNDVRISGAGSLRLREGLEGGSAEAVDRRR